MVFTNKEDVCINVATMNHMKNDPGVLNHCYNEKDIFDMDHMEKCLLDSF